MNTRGIARPLFASLLIVIGLLLVFGFTVKPSRVAEGGKTLRLQAPSFVGVANAETNSAGLDIGALLDQEAGISAYFRSPDAINLNQVRGLFRTIEAETADYIIGSVPVAGYDENADAHVYVHTNGWILAYYLRSHPVSKIIDVGASSITNTKLKSVVATVASAAGAPFNDVTYYDFLYPNATHMILIAEDLANGNDFTIQLPSTYGYFERGWALNNFDGFVTHFTLDGVDIRPSYSGSDRTNVWYGSITASQLPPDVTHTVSVDGWGALVILYRVP